MSYTGLDRDTSVSIFRIKWEIHCCYCCHSHKQNGRTEESSHDRICEEVTNDDTAVAHLKRVHHFFLGADIDVRYFDLIDLSVSVTHAYGEIYSKEKVHKKYQVT